MSLFDAMLVLLGFPLWLALPTPCLYQSIKGARSGSVKVKGSSYERRSEPKLFWASIVTYLTFVAFWAGLTTSVILDELNKA